MFLIHLCALAFDLLQFAYFVQVSCHTGTIEISCKFSLQSIFSNQGQSNTSMASSSTSHAPPLALSIVSKPSNPYPNEPPTKKLKRSYDKS
jgi:hypothetical protein